MAKCIRNEVTGQVLRVSAEEASARVILSAEWSYVDKATWRRAKQAEQAQK